MIPVSHVSDPTLPDRPTDGADLTFVDTHIHLDEPDFAGDVEAVIDRAIELGVRHLVNIAYRPSRWASSASLKLRFPDVSVAVGLHPGHADEFTERTIDEIDRVIDQVKAVAIGEIGVDHFRPGFDAALQERAFRAQVELAVSRSLPIIIHQRAAEADCVRVLRDAPPDLAVVLHSFDGSWELGRLGIDRAYYFGVGGLMTRGGAGLVREILTHVPADRLLLETDAPYLTPNGVKLRRNEPANIPLIADRLAALRRVDRAEMARVTTMNAMGVFRLGRPETEPSTTDVRGTRNGGITAAPGHVESR